MRRLSILAILMLASIGAHATSAKWTGQIQPRAAHDFNAAPNIVEVVIVAHERKVRFKKNQRATKVWTYNGGTPGPTIHGNVGDTLIVHFYNFLPEESSIHWHGLELPANMDGSHIAQNPVPSGGYFRYEFDLLRASTFWYHPHVRSNEQVEKGLYGGLVVHDPQQDRELGLPKRESLLILDDVLLGDDGQIVQPFPDNPLENALTQVNGRVGNTLLVNGKAQAIGRLKANVPHRLRLINASNTRFMRVSIPGHRLWRIGGDAGLLETPIEIQPIGLVHNMPHEMHGMAASEMPAAMVSDPDISKGILLTPGERADVVFTPTEKRLELEWHDLPRGKHSAFYNDDGSIGLGHAHDDGHRPAERLLGIKTYGRRGNGGDEYIPPNLLSTITPIDAASSPKLPVMFGHTPPDANGDIVFFSQMKDGMPLPFSKVTAADAPTVTVGDRRIIEVNNLTGGHHNFHLHGFVFQHIETQYIDMDTPENNRTVAATHLENKDTILIPQRSGAKGRSRTITRLALIVDDAGREGQIAASGKVPDEENSGGWLFHCHILEHSARGMMSFLQVVE